MHTKTNFEYLRSKINEWRDNGMLIPPAESSRNRFRIWTEKEAKPILSLLAQTLSEAGLYTELLEGDDEMPGIGIFIHRFNVTLQIVPAPTDSRFVRFSVQGGCADIEKQLPYQILPNGNLGAILVKAILECLAPQHPWS